MTAGPRGSADLPLPANLAAERVVLGTVIEDDRLLPEIIESGLRPQDFSLSDHQAVFRAVLALREKNCPVDYITVAEQLGNRQQDYVVIAGLVHGVVVNEDHVLYHVQIVRRKAKLRALLKLAEWIATQVGEETNPNMVAEEILRRTDECRTK